MDCECTKVARETVHNAMTKNALGAERSKDLVDLLAHIKRGCSKRNAARSDVEVCAERTSETARSTGPLTSPCVKRAKSKAERHAAHKKETRRNGKTLKVTSLA